MARNTFTSLGFPSEMADVLDSDAKSPESGEAATAIKAGVDTLVVGTIEDDQIVVRNGNTLVGIDGVSQIVANGETFSLGDWDEGQVLTAIAPGAAGGAYVDRLREDGGELLLIGSIADGESVLRNGNNLIGGNPATVNVNGTPVSFGAIGDGQMVVRSGNELVGQDVGGGGGGNLVFVGSAFGPNVGNTFACHLFPMQPVGAAGQPLGALMPVAGTIRNFRLRFLVTAGGVGMSLYVFVNGNLETQISIPNGGATETDFTNTANAIGVGVGDNVRILMDGSLSPGESALATLTFELEPV